MLDRIAQFIARHAMFSSGRRVGVAVSGGADSVFLLHALRELAPHWDLQLSVIHIEHGIRGAESQADAEFVRALAAGFELPLHVHHADVLSIQGNLEEAARNVRQAFYAGLIASGTLDRIATGHTRSDQAETVLYRILRGSGLTGLSGILPITREGLVRPLLEIDRSEIETWLKDRSMAWREDLSNQDRAYARNRLRHDVLPLLRESFNPQLDTALAHLATLARDEESYWQSQLFRQSPIPNPGEPLVLPVSDLTSVPVAVARRRLRHALGEASPDFSHMERILELAHSPSGDGRLQIPGLDVRRSFDWLRFSKFNSEPEQAGFAFALEPPGSVELPGSKTRIMLQVIPLQTLEKEAGKRAGEAPHVTVGDETVGNELDWQRFHSGNGAPRLELRNWRAGDRYQPIGRSKAENIKFFFQEARIPLWERENWPIITYNGIIVWTRRFGAALNFASGPETRSVLQVTEMEAHIANPRNGL